MAQSPKSLPLFAGEPSPPPRNLGFWQPRSNQLWIAVHLPELVVEALSNHRSHEAVVVVEARGGHRRIVAASKKARARGIKPGLKLNAAFALTDDLGVQERSLQTELAKLELLAKWARRFTPSVSLEPPQALLMEVSGSLRLFGGLGAIKEALEEECKRRKFTVHLCAAPTALAALWLARHGCEDVRLPEQLVGWLSALPLHVTGWPDKTQVLLNSFGVQTIGDCLRLSRAGFVRRVGEQYLRDLDRLLGSHDPRPEFEPARRLSSMFEFSDEVIDPAILAAGGEKLIEDLVKALRNHQAQIQSFELGFHHVRRPVTVEQIFLAEATHDQERLGRLLWDRLEHISLPAPVIALGLRTGRIEPVVECKASLFSNRTRSGLKTGMAELVERLRGRLGTGGIHGVILVEEHRPEAAWARLTDPLLQRSPSVPPASPWAHHRPLWILPSPLLLRRTTAGLPHYQDGEPLRLDSGPERIESGWWDGGDIGRDYYVASSVKGEKLWVYRDRVDLTWYLHGIFG
jgi:protein ImuB